MRDKVLGVERGADDYLTTSDDYPGGPVGTPGGCAGMAPSTKRPQLAAIRVTPCALILKVPVPEPSRSLVPFRRASRKGVQPTRIQSPVPTGHILLRPGCSMPSNSGALAAGPVRTLTQHAALVAVISRFGPGREGPEWRVTPAGPCAARGGSGRRAGGGF